MKDDVYRLVRSVAKSMTFEEADNHISFWSEKSGDERLNAACFVINNIYGVTPQTKVNRTVITNWKHQYGSH